MAPPSGRTFHGNPREEAQRDAAGIKLLQKKMPQPSPRRPSEGDRVLLRTKPREKLDEVLALKARLTMHKWKKDGSTYFPLTNGNTEELQVGKKEKDKNSERNKSGRGQRGEKLRGKSDNLKSILDNYPGNDEAFAPPPRIADKNEEGKVLDKADLVDAVSNILMQMPPENILESSSAISMLARKLVDGNNSAIDSSFSQKFLIMSQIQVEVQRRLKEAKGYIEEIENMDKVQNPKVIRRRQSSIANIIRILHGGAPSAPPPSKSEQVANQMRTIRRLLQSLHWPNLHHEFLKWVRNSAGYEAGVRDFLRGMEEDFDRFDEIDLSRDDVCTSITKHELRLTKNLRRYQLQMRNAGQDLAKGEISAKLDKDLRKLDHALERKANDKKAEIRRISLRRQFTSSVGLGARSPRGSPSPRSSRRSSVQRGGSSAATPSANSTESDEARESPQADDTPSHQSDGQGEFDINRFDDARFGHLKRIYKNHELKIEALNDSLARDNLRLKKVIEELKDQVRRLLELQDLYESKTKNTLRRGSLFVPRRRALMMNRNEADANNVNILAKRIAHLQGERADLMDKIKELGKSLLEQKEKPRRGAIVNQIWTIVQEDSPDTEELARLVSGELHHAKVKGNIDAKDLEEPLEAEASEEEDQEEPENDRGGQAMQHRIQKLNQELDDIKQQITALASEVNQKAVPMSLGKAVAFEIQPQMRLIIHYTPLRPEIDFLVKKSEELLALPKMQTAQSKKTLNDTFELAKDTFDTEAAERKKCLQDAKLAFDAPKWEQELGECIALLTEQLMSCLTELTQDQPRRKSDPQEPGASTALQDFQGRRPSAAGMQSVEGRHARAGQVGATAEETGGSLQGEGAAFSKVDLADLEARRAEEARLRAQAQEAEKILKVHSKIRKTDEEIKKLLEEISQARAQQEAVDVPVEAPTVTSTHAAESESKRRRNSRVVDEDPDEKVLGLIKAEGRKKLRILQTRNVKYKLLKKLLDQAGILDELRLQQSAPETNEERVERLQKDMENAHDRNRRLSKQLEFWDSRIEKRKSMLDTEKSKLRKEFGRDWEQKLEHALMEQDQPDAHDVESIQSLEPEEEMPAPDFDLDMMRQNQEMEDLINNRKGHVIAKKYSRQIRSTMFRRRAEAEQAEQTEALQDSPQRKPLGAFPEVEEEQGETSEGLLQLSLEGECLLAPQQHLIRSHSRTSFTSESEDTSESESSFVEEDVDLGPFRQSHRKGILETGAEDYMMSQFGDPPTESFLEGINRLRPSARHYTHGTRREGPGKKKKSKRRVSIQSFVDELSEGPNSRRPSTATEVGHARRFSVDGEPGSQPRGLEIYNSRISRASIESRPFSEGDRGEIHDIVREAMEVERKEDIDVNEWLQKVLRQKQRRDKRNKAGKLKGNVIDGGDVHIETVRLLRRAAQMAKKTKVSPDDLSIANLLQANHMDLSISGQGNAQHLQLTSKAEALLRQLVGQDEETWEQSLANRAATARARYKATKAQLLALDTMEPPVRSASKKEALKRYRARTASPVRSMSDLARSPIRSRSKIGRDLSGDAMNRAATEAAALSRLDARKEITRLKVMSLHHSAARRRMMQASLSSDEEDEAGGKSIMELAEASRKMQDFRGPSERVISQVLSNVSNMMSGPTAFFEEEAQDEKVAEVAAKWLGERSDTQPSLMVDASEAQATAVPISHSAFRPFRSRSKAPRKIRPPRPTSSVAGNGTSSSSDSEGFRSSRSTSRREGSAHSQRGENVHFRNVSYFIDLMNENDHRKRSKKQSKRRRKARERQKKQATRADFRWNSHMWRLMELQLDNPRPIAHKVRTAHGIATHTGSDEDKVSHSPRFLQVRTPQRRRGRTPRKRIDEGRTDPQARQVEHLGETHAMIGKEKQADSGAALDLSPKSVQIKLEEGGWTRLPAISQGLSDSRRASASSESTSLQSPWWGRRPQRFGASRARVDFSTSEAERDRLRVQQWAEVGALAMGLPQKWSYQARA